MLTETGENMVIVRPVGAALHPTVVPDNHIAMVPHMGGMGPMHHVAVVPHRAGMGPMHHVVGMMPHLEALEP